VLFFRASYNDLNEKHQPDAVNKYIFHLCSVSTCFVHFIDLLMMGNVLPETCRD